MLMFLRQIIVASLLIFVTTTTVHAASDTEEFWTYKVRPDDSIWNISRELLTDMHRWQDVVAINNIGNDKLMMPGSTLLIPKAWVIERPAITSVIKISGIVTALHNGVSTELKGNETLKPTTTIYTTKGSSALIKLEDKTQVLLLENSDLLIHSASILGKNNNAINIVLNLSRGEVEVDANSVNSGGSYFLIKTPVAHATTRGTVYRVRANGKVMITEVSQGKVLVGNTLGGVDIAAGYGTLTKKDVAPSTPKKLLIAPTLLTAIKQIRTLPAELNFSPLTNASSYRLQISASKQFNSIIYDEIQQQPAFELTSSILDGDYFLRARAIDTTGVQGYDSTAAIEIDARPYTPHLIEPATNLVSYKQNIVFAWQAEPSASSYRIEVANNSNFTELHTQVETQQTSHTIALPAGKYFWRLIAVDESGVHSLASESRQLETRLSPPSLSAPNVVLTNLDDNNERSLSLTWPKNLPNIVYEVEMAKSSTFSNILYKHTTKNTSLTMKIPESFGSFQIRIRALDQYGTAGEWSQAVAVSAPFDQEGATIFSIIAMLILLL